LSFRIVFLSAVAMQRSLAMARQVAGLSARSLGSCPTYSTLVDLGGIPCQYALPLTFLSVPSTEPLSRPGILPLHHPPNTTFLQAVVRRDTSLALAVPPAWHVTCSPSQPPLLPVTRLQNTLPTEDLEPPKPENPKWEEEEYPEIGKSNVYEPRLYINTFSNRHPLQPSPLHPYTTPSNINPRSQN
jgi:hypothetical protein